MKIKIFLVSSIIFISFPIISMDWWGGVDSSWKEQRSKFRQEQAKNKQQATQELLNILNKLATNPVDINSIKKIIADGADVNAQDTRGRTALSLTIIHQRIDIGQLLLENGALINIPIVINNMTIDLLEVAIRALNPALVKLLLEYQADPDKHLGHDSPPPLINTISLYSDFPNETSQIDQIVQLLLEFGADPNISYENVTPLEIAINANQIEAVRLLLQAGANPIKALPLAQNLLEREKFIFSIHQIMDPQTTNTNIEILTKIIEMLLNPEKIQKKGFTKLRSTKEKTIEEYRIREEIERIKVSDEYKKSAQEAAKKYLEQLRKEKQ